MSGPSGHGVSVEVSEGVSGVCFEVTTHVETWECVCSMELCYAAIPASYHANTHLQW